MKKILTMEAEETYKYLGIKEAQQIKQQTMKQKLTKGFLSRIQP